MRAWVGACAAGKNWHYPSIRFGSLLLGRRRLHSIVGIYSVARWQNLIPSFPWIAPRFEGRRHKEERDQILLCSVMEPYSFMPKGPNLYNLKIWL